MPLTFTRRQTLAASIALAAGAGGARAQGQPIRFVIGAAAGGSIDAYARVVSEHMGRTLGRPTIVENRAGASGNLAAQMVVEAPADGATLFVGTMAMCEINPVIFTNLRWSMQDFAPLAKGVEAPLVFVAHPSVPANSMDEFAAWAKPQRGKLSYASFSPGTPSHFLGAQLNDAYGLDMGHLPYRGSAPQINDMVAGHAQFGFTQIQSALPHVEAGRLKAYAVTSEKRFRLMPNTPTFAEIGKPEFNTAIWFGLLARAATPPDVIAKLTEAARAAHADAKVRQTLEPQGFDMSSQSGEAFGRAIADGSARWDRLVKATGFKASE